MKNIKISEIEWEEGKVYKDSINGHLWKVDINSWEWNKSKNLIMIDFETDITEKYSLGFITSEMEFIDVSDCCALKLNIPLYTIEDGEIGDTSFLGVNSIGNYCLSECLNTLECKTLFNSEEVEKIMEKTSKSFLGKITCVKPE